MGWKPPERYRDTYRLSFADPEYQGLEVVVRRVRFGDFRATAKMGTLDAEKLARGHMDPEDLATMRQAVDALGSSLVSWNLLDHDGEPVPCTVEALDQQDLAFGLELVSAWWLAAKQHQLPQEPPDAVAESQLPVDALG